MKPDFEYKKIFVEFFGRRGVVLRFNTIIELKNTSGIFEIPSEVFKPPAQRWFNFHIEDKNGNKIWGLVDYSAIINESKIDIDDVSGEGNAFLFLD